MAAEVILIACEREPYRAFYIVSDRLGPASASPSRRP